MDFASFLPPGIALVFILRRGLKPARIKPNRLWVFPAIITFLAVSSLSSGKALSAVDIAIYVAIILAGGALGWFTTRHVELTLDEATGTVMSRPTPLGTAMTVAAFGARFALDLLTKAPSGHGASAFAVQHGASLALVANASLLFVAARGLTRAWHMWQRVHPLLAQHRATQAQLDRNPNAQR